MTVIDVKEDELLKVSVLETLWHRDHPICNDCGAVISTLDPTMHQCGPKGRRRTVKMKAPGAYRTRSTK